MEFWHGASTPPRPEGYAAAERVGGMEPPIVSPDGRHWWDGSAWQPVPAPAPPPAPKDPRPFWRRHLKAILITGGVIFVLLCLANYTPKPVCVSSGTPGDMGTPICTQVTSP